MKKPFLFLLVLILLNTGSYSQDIVNDNFVITHGPYIQNLNSKAATIIWTTNKPALPGVKIRTGKNENRFIRNSHEGIIDGGGLFHKVTISIRAVVKDTGGKQIAEYILK